MKTYENKKIVAITLPIFYSILKQVTYLKFYALIFNLMLLKVRIIFN